MNPKSQQVQQVQQLKVCQVKGKRRSPDGAAWEKFQPKLYRVFVGARKLARLTYHGFQSFRGGTSLREHLVHRDGAKRGKPIPALQPYHAEGKAALARQDFECARDVLTEAINIRVDSHKCAPLATALPFAQRGVCVFTGLPEFTRVADFSLDVGSSKIRWYKVFDTHLCTLDAEDAEKVIALQPNATDGYYHKGFALYHQKDYGEAVSEIALASEIWFLAIRTRVPGGPEVEPFGSRPAPGKSLHGHQSLALSRLPTRKRILSSLGISNKRGRSPSLRNPRGGHTRYRRFQQKRRETPSWGSEYKQQLDIARETGE
eukprot:1194447-Prorocentrum_minimum.AAC.7